MTMHGGDVYTAAAALGIPVRKVIDFSASVNPLGPSKKVKAAIREKLKELGRYPDTSCRRLTRRIAQTYRLDEGKILCGNGSNELIHLVCAALRPSRVLVTAPSFSEYSVAAAISGATLITLPLSEGKNFEIDPDGFADAMRHADLAFLGNPNNPTGTVLPPEAILHILDRAAETGCMLVVDEAFVDFLPAGDEFSAARLVGEGRKIIVLRSLTKYHSLAGLRIGFGVFPQDVLDRIRRIRDPWSVSTLAQEAAFVALGDKVFSRETARWLEAEKPYLRTALEKLGFSLFPSAVNYLLVQHPEAVRIRERLYHRGILLRDCSNFTGLDEKYLRIAVRSHRENARLVRELGYAIRRLTDHTEPDRDGEDAS